MILNMKLWAGALFICVAHYLQGMYLNVLFRELEIIYASLI